MCDQVKTDAIGRSWFIENRYPLGSCGNPLTTVFKQKDEAETALEKWKQHGMAFELKCNEINARFPNLNEIVIHQLNYRIQSREVSNWE